VRRYAPVRRGGASGAGGEVVKFPRFGIGETLLGLSVVGLVTIASILAGRALETAPLRYSAFEVVDTPPGVIATAIRRDTEGCTNGPQADLMDAKGSITRLPVPARTVQGSTSIYPLIIPEGVARGRYAVQVRENFLCAGREPQIIESPWLPLEIK